MKSNKELCLKMSNLGVSYTKKKKKNGKLNKKKKEKITEKMMITVSSFFPCFKYDNFFMCPVRFQIYLLS